MYAILFSFHNSVTHNLQSTGKAIEAQRSIVTSLPSGSQHRWWAGVTRRPALFLLLIGAEVGRTVKSRGSHKAGVQEKSVKHVCSRVSRAVQSQNIQD